MKTGKERQWNKKIEKEIYFPIENKYLLIIACCADNILKLWSCKI